MKKQALYRIIGIGIFHAVLYLYVVPFVIYPKFGESGFVFAISFAIIISITVLGTMFINKKKGDKNE